MTPPDPTDPTTTRRPDADRSIGDDPRQIREHLMRSRHLAHTHGLPSVVVGVAGRAGDRMIPEFLSFVESALRVEDSIFRMTRDRAVLFLADVDREQADGIVRRLLDDFAGRFPSVHPAAPVMGFYQVEPGCAELSVKEVLPAVFPGPGTSTH